MSPSRPRIPIFFLIALGVVGGVWLLRLQGPAEPIESWAQWRSQLFLPQAEDRLSLAELAQAAPGELWLQGRIDGARLLYRAPLAAEQGWRLQAEVALPTEQRDSLVVAAGLQGRSDQQRLPEQFVTQLGSQGIDGLTLEPEEKLTAATLLATLGEPRLRLQMSEGEAWVYPEQGLTAHLRDDQLVSLQVVPLKRFRR